MSQISDKKSGSFGDFQNLCNKIGSNTARLTKTAHISQFYGNYCGDLQVLLELILPKATKRIYNMGKKKIWKIFGLIFNIDEKELINDYQDGINAGMIGNVISNAYSNVISNNNNFANQKKGTILSMYDVNEYLKKLTTVTKEMDQFKLLNEVTSKCNINDLKWFLRLMDKDLKVDAGTKTVLDGIDSKAYKAFQMKANIGYIVNQLSMGNQLTSNGASLMIPMKPMLAQACKSYEMAFLKCKSGLIYAEIKYDGERVQIHWDGNTWKFYSRSLKPVTQSKIIHVIDDIPLSCPNANNIILDSEILMVDKVTGNPLPFGSLGKHKKLEFKNATPCLFVFDILYFNGKSLIDTPLKERRDLLEKNFKPIKNSIHLSELTKIENTDALMDLMENAIENNQEGLVLKDSEGVYAPNKRHWLKLKVDYLGSGQMADSADLVILGAYEGKGRHGGTYSTFLMGCLDTDNSVFKTVCKAHNGLDDEQIQYFTDTLMMEDYKRENCPQWLDVSSNLEPDWIVKNPKKSPVLEVSGFEFSESRYHTATDANGKPFSIRFPRVTKIRNDKNYKTSTSLQELRELVKTSRDNPALKLKQHNKKQKKDNNNNNSNNGNGNGKRKAGATVINGNGKRNIGTLDDFVVPKKKKRKMNSNDSDNENANNDSNNGDIIVVVNGNANGHNNNNSNNSNNIIINNNNNNNVESDVDEDIDLDVDLDVVIPDRDDNDEFYDVNDSRDECQFGGKCYRKNPAHLQQYKHTQRLKNDIKKLKQKTDEQISQQKSNQSTKLSELNEWKQTQISEAKELHKAVLQLEQQKLNDNIHKFKSEYSIKLNDIKSDLSEQIKQLCDDEQDKIKEIKQKFGL